MGVCLKSLAIELPKPEPTVENPLISSAELLREKARLLEKTGARPDLTV